MMISSTYIAKHICSVMKNYASFIALGHNLSSQLNIHETLQLKSPIHEEIDKRSDFFSKYWLLNKIEKIVRGRIESVTLCNFQD